MSPTPELQDLIQSVRDEAADGDLLAQLAKASEYAGDLNQLSIGLPENIFIAALAIASVPTIVFFLIFQRNIMSGLTAGSLKG